MQKNGEPKRLEDFAGYNLRRASNVVLSDFADMFAGSGVRPTSFSVACVIDEQPGTTSAEICRILGLQRANIVALLAELDALGTIRRVDDENDKRSQRLYLTDRGEVDLAAWRAMAASHETRALSRLSDDEQAQLVDMLRRIWRDA